MKLWLGLAWLLTAFAQDRPIVVIAHRGEHLHHVENSLPAFEAAFDAGADFVELDVRTASNGRLVLLHDNLPSKLVTGDGLATFDEALALARSRGRRVYVDSKQVSPADAIEAIERHEMGERVVIYGSVRYLREIADRRPSWRVMPEAVSAEHLRELLKTMKLKVVAFDAADFNDETIAVARAAGVEIYVDCLGRNDRAEAWQDALRRGATGIQTDHPAELVAFLKENNRR